MAGIIGRKLGMTQVFTEDGERIPVTVIQAGPCPSPLSASRRDGYRADPARLWGDARTRLTKPRARPSEEGGRTAGAGSSIEFRDLDVDTEPKIGDEREVDSFSKGASSER